jgi:hypothetical protein
MTTVTADIYIVRVWLEPSQQGPIWRASITDARSHEKHYFANPDALVLFCEDHMFKSYHLAADIENSR